MLRLLSLLLLLFLAACKKSGASAGSGADTGVDAGSGALATIEEGEAYAQAHGVVLGEKDENKEQRVARRAYRYKTASAVDVEVFQFASPEAAAAWKKLSDEMQMGHEMLAPKGSVVFSVWGSTGAERQKVIDALK